jgi:hypothetical protein
MVAQQQTKGQVPTIQKLALTGSCFTFNEFQVLKRK